ncbi:vacuolar protein sorting-associated protein 72 homolog [Patella vulgata]|uniref:vacuolar protein sorting-associated protein 72 homolog n=1 Tax=Patella vulgata TaxID=6465 RepID=UPI00217F39B1|nr:vacuolar protein sorting-associated protein 72 homolog [Patella vulgata]
MSSSSEEEEEKVAFLAVTREKRSNAGSKMAKLLNEEEEDEFYTTTYGGFKEEAEDIDYDSGKSDSDDVIDSDFDIDEVDEVKSDMEDDEPKKKKHTTGVYKEPTEKKPKVIKPEVKKEKKEPKVKSEKSSVQIYQSTSPLIERKSKRAATAVKSQATAKREKQREERTKMMKEMAARKNVPEVRRLTQEELLSEAKITEAENKKSLENYYKLELEKKKSRIQKQVFKGPIIRYHSVTMPCLEELAIEPDIIVDGEGSNEAVRKIEEMETGEKCSRSFITFTEEKTYHEYFSSKKQKLPQRPICPVTKLPAKYFDPITQTPYATLNAFKCIRDAYIQQCESSQKRSKPTPEPKQPAPNTVTVNG